MEKMVFSELEDKDCNEEILRIKLILDNHNEQSDAILFHSLRKLRNLQPPLSFHTLQATLIGKSVNALRKHGSMEIQNLVKTLIREWKKTVELWLDATDAIADPISCEEQNPNLERKDTHKLKSASPDQPRTPPKIMKAEPKTSLDYEEGGDEGDDDKEVLRIKGILDNHLEESDGTLLECLRKLQLLSVSLYTLKATRIGKSVNALRKHGSKEIQKLVWRLIEDWKKMVDSGLATNAIADPRSCEEENQNRESDRSKPTCVEKMEVHKLKNMGPDEPRCSPKHMKIKIVLKRKAPVEPNGAETGTAAAKRSKYDSDPGRLNPVGQKNQMLQQEMKLEAARKRLHERYQEVENAKKQRRIVFEVNDGPNSGNRNRNRANKRRLHL